MRTRGNAGRLLRRERESGVSDRSDGWGNGDGFECPLGNHIDRTLRRIHCGGEA